METLAPLNHAEGSSSIISAIYAIDADDVTLWPTPILTGGRHCIDENIQTTPGHTWQRIMPLDVEATYQHTREQANGVLYSHTTLGLSTLGAMVEAMEATMQQYSGRRLVVLFQHAGSGAWMLLGSPTHPARLAYNSGNDAVAGGPGFAITLVADTPHAPLLYTGLASLGARGDVLGTW